MGRGPGRLPAGLTGLTNSLIPRECIETIGIGLSTKIVSALTRAVGQVPSPGRVIGESSPIQGQDRGGVEKVETNPRPRLSGLDLDFDSTKAVSTAPLALTIYTEHKPCKTVFNASAALKMKKRIWLLSVRRVLRHAFQVQCFYCSARSQTCGYVRMATTLRCSINLSVVPVMLTFLQP